MKAINQSNDKRLRHLLEKIQEIKRINIGDISVLAGYKRENYLSERLSSNEISNKVVDAVERLYERAKLDASVLNVTKKQEDMVPASEHIAALNEVIRLQRELLESKQPSKNQSVPSEKIRKVN